MTVFHVEFAKAGTGVSGGEVCMLEMIKYLDKRNINNVVLTTDNGKASFERLLPSSKNINYITVDSYQIEKKLGMFISYIYRTVLSVKLIKNIKLNSSDLVICHSEFFPNSISSWLLTRNNNHTQSAQFFHMRAPDIFKGYEGQFTGKIQFPKVRIVHYRLNQYLYKLLTKPSTIIFSVNSYNNKYLKKSYPHNQIRTLKSFGGTDNTSKSFTNKVTKKYDLIWIGRFHPQKGLKDLLEIIEKTTVSIPDLQVVVLGDGDTNIRKYFINTLKEKKLLKTVHWPGFVTGREKLSYLNQSKIFVMPSHYESMPIVIIEALSSKVPVVAYDLPVYQSLGSDILKSPILDTDAMAKWLSYLLTHKRAYAKAVAEATVAGQKHSWEQTGNEAFEGLLNK